jgi:hypothetical protein
MSPRRVKLRILTPQILALFNPFPTLFHKLCELLTKRSCLATTLFTTPDDIRHLFIELVT